MIELYLKVIKKLNTGIIVKYILGLQDITYKLSSCKESLSY